MSRSGQDQGERARLMSQQEAAQRLGVNIRTLDKLEASGQLKMVRLGRRRLVSSLEVARIIRGGVL